MRYEIFFLKSRIGNLPANILLFSVLVGLLVLFIISSILHRLGFFKRKRPNVEEDDSDLMMSAHFEKVRLNSDY